MLTPAAAIAAHAPICATQRLDQMVAHYADIQKRQDIAAISHLYGSEGEVINPGAAPVRGEVAVNAFLSGFRGYVVSVNELAIDAIAVRDSVWQVTGHFHQAGRTPTATSYDVHGHFDSRWRCTPGGWRIARMETTP